MTIQLVPIRATITIGALTVSTPYIQSFNVRKTRGQISSFDASLKVDHGAITGSNMGGFVTISAGSSGQSKIYTGILKKSTVSPCWDDPGYVLLNISGTDVLSHLQGKKYTRRCRATKSTWISIDSVTREGLRDGKFKKEHQVLSTMPSAIEKAQEPTKTAMPSAKAYTPKSETEKVVIVNFTSIVGTDPGQGVA